LFSLLAPPNTSSLSGKVVASVATQIDEGALAPGAKLPPEAELVRQYGVSRTVVREAMQRLQAMGLIVTRHGIGSFVREDLERTPLGLEAVNPAVAHDLVAIMELRIGLETEAAALAAQRRTDGDLVAMQQALSTFIYETNNASSGVDADFSFHLAIARAAHSRYFLEILSSLGPGSIPRSRLRVEAQEVAPRAYLTRVHLEHEDIYDAIRRGDADAARAAVRNHLGNGRERMRRAAEESTARMQQPARAHQSAR
jgi:DNA-binding FadR family transcriptional regulator